MKLNLSGEGLLCLHELCERVRIILLFSGIADREQQQALLTSIAESAILPESITGAVDMVISGSML
jgi:hypothetical protein